MPIKYNLRNQTLMAQHCVLHLFFNKKHFALVRGYSAEKIFHRGYITEKRLRTTALEINTDLQTNTLTDTHPCRHTHLQTHTLFTNKPGERGLCKKLQQLGAQRSQSSFLFLCKQHTSLTRPPPPPPLCFSPLRLVSCSEHERRVLKCRYQRAEGRWGGEIASSLQGEDYVQKTWLEAECSCFSSLTSISSDGRSCGDS